MPGISVRPTWLSETTASSAKPPVGWNSPGVGLVAAQLERGGDVQAELVSAVGNAATRGPAVLLEHFLDPQVLGQPVAQGGVDLDIVAIGTHPAVADQIAGILHGEQVLTR